MISELREDSQRETLVNKLGVYELRGLARELGISSPTTKKRAELVSLILDAFNNGVTLSSNSQKRGRPYKKLTSIEEIVNSVGDFDRRGGEINYNSIISLAQETKPVFCLEDGKIAPFIGIARRTDKSLVVNALQTEATVFVEDVMFADKIQTGDVVELTAKDLGENNYLAISIDKINGKDSYIFNRIVLPMGEQIISNEMLPFAGGDVKIGTRNATMLKEDLYENLQFRNFLVACDRQGYKFILLGVNTSVENKIMFNKLNILYNFTTEYGTEPALNLSKVVDGLNLAEKMLERGEKVLVVVSDIIALMLGIDKCFEKEEGEEFAEETIIVAKRLLSLAKAYENGKSTTLLMYYSPLDKENKFLNNDILRISKQI